MKPFLLFVLFALIFYSAEGQDYIQTFDTSGKLEKVESAGKVVYPSILSRGKVTLNTASISVPDSKFTSSIIAFYKKNIPMVKQKSVFLESQFTLMKNVGSTIFANGASTSSKIYKLNNLAATDILVYDSDPNEKYLPVKIDKKSDAIKIASRHFKADDPDNPDKKADKEIKFEADKYYKIEYDVVRLEPDNEILAKHLEKTKDDYKGIPDTYEKILRNIRKPFQSHGLIINEKLVRDTLLQKKADIPDYFNIDIVKEIDQIKNEAKFIPAIYDHVLTINKEWIQSWLWYTEGKVQLNPFDVTADTTNLIIGLDAQIAELEQQLKSLQLCVQYKMTDSCRFADISPEINSISAYILELKIKRLNAAQLGANFKAWISQRTKKSQILYSGIWHTSTIEKIAWLKHYDAAKSFNLIEKSQALPVMVAETDELLINIHNVKAADKIKSSSSLAVFSPKSQFEQTLEEIAAQFGATADGVGLSQLAGTLIPKAINAVEPPITITVSGSTIIENNKARVKCIDLIKTEFAYKRINYANREEIIESLLNVCNAAETNSITLLNNLLKADKSRFVIILYEQLGIKDIVDYKALVDNYIDNQAMLNWLLTQTRPPLELALEADKNPVFRTVVEFPEKNLDISTSSKISYSVNRGDDKEPAIKGSYKKYTQVRFLPTIGLAYIPENRTATIYDNATGQFGSDRQFDNVEVFVGVKWYPFQKTNPVPDLRTRKLIRENINKGIKANYIRGYSFGNSPFLTFGMGVRHKILKNYNAGIGLDLFPGVSAHVGYNFIFHRFYNLQNGKIINEQERPKGYPYFSISFDPGIVTNLVKLLITK